MHKKPKLTNYLKSALNKCYFRATHRFRENISMNIVNTYIYFIFVNVSTEQWYKHGHKVPVVSTNMKMFKYVLLKLTCFIVRY